MLRLRVLRPVGRSSTIGTGTGTGRTVMHLSLVLLFKSIYIA